jgi:hypothetical protein
VKRSLVQTAPPALPDGCDHLTAAEIGRALRRTARTVRVWAGKGLLPPPAVRIGTYWLWDKNDILPLLGKGGEA